MIIIYITICITLVALGLGIAALVKAGKRGPPGPPGGGGADGGHGGGGISPDDLDNAVKTAVCEQLPETYVKYGDPLNILDNNGLTLLNIFWEADGSRIGTPHFAQQPTNVGTHHKIIDVETKETCDTADTALQASIKFTKCTNEYCNKTYSPDNYCS
jgi:hypothetical protein